MSYGGAPDSPSVFAPMLPTLADATPALSP
jgi:hypothetical protein